MGFLRTRAVRRHGLCAQASQSGNAMQKKRVVVTLDPDYIPWEHSEDTVKLRHKRPPKWILAVVLVIGVVIMAVINQARINRQLTQQQNSSVLIVPTETPEPASIPQGWCEYAGILLPPGTHTIGDRQRECKNGQLTP